MLLGSVMSVCEPLDCSPKGSSVHGIFQAKILKPLAISSSRGSSDQRTKPCLLGLLHWKGIFFLVLWRKKWGKKKKKLPKYFPEWWPDASFLSAMNENSHCSASLLAVGIVADFFCFHFFIIWYNFTNILIISAIIIVYSNLYPPFFPICLCWLIFFFF